MALDGTYTGLLASIAGWLKRSDLTATLPDFVSLCEGRIATDLRIRNQVLTTTWNTVASVQTVALPADFLELENLTLNTTPNRPLTYITPEQMDKEFPVGSGTGRPQAYTIIGQLLYFGPVPDQAYGIGAQYYQRFSPLATTPTNWLLVNYPAVYLYGALCEAAPWLIEDDRIAVWEGKYKSTVDSLQTTDDTALRSGSVMRVRVVV